MKTITIYASTDNAFVVGSSTDYSTARGTASEHDYQLDPDYFFDDTGYKVMRSFLRFDTSVIPAGSAIVNAQMRMTVYDASIAMDHSFDVEIMQQDWKAQNPITNANMDTAYDGALTSSTDTLFKNFTGFWLPDAGVLYRGKTYYSNYIDASYISTTTDTYYSLRTSDDSGNSAPTTGEYVFFYSADATLNSQKPALIINYYESADADGITWLLEFDWDGTEDITSWVNEAGRVTRFRLDRGRDHTIGAPGSGFEAPQVGKLILDMDNFDNRYDPWNKDGALYGKIAPGVRVNFACIYDSTYYNLFTGFIRDIQPKGRREHVTMTIEDGAGWLRERTPDISMLTSAGVDDAIEAILDDLEYPFGRTVETGVNNLSYYWTTGKNALTEIHNLASADFGRFCVNADGKAHFRSRYNADAIEHILTEDQIGKDIYIPMPWDYSRDIVDVLVYPRVAGSTDTTLWTLQDTPAIAGNDILTLWAEYRYDGEDVPAADVYLSSVAPFVTDEVTVTAFSRYAKVEIENTSGASRTLTSLVLKGTPITSPDRLKISKEQDEVDIPASFVFDYEWLSSITTAEDFAEILLAYLTDAKQYPEITIHNRPELACNIDLEERLRLILDTYDLDKTFFINKISHLSGRSMQDLITRIHLTPMLQDQSDNVLVLSSTDNGILDTNVLGF